MDITLEHPVHARLITTGRELPVPVTLRYTSADPLAVHLDFPAHISLTGQAATWTFARSLLEEGLDAAAGLGSVHIWPCGPLRTVVELHAPEGVAMVWFDPAVLRRFLLRSYTVVEPAEENLTEAFDQGLTSLLGGV
ncbi:SsgA family sporulation/cell division regulator [Streptomyces sp. NPDC051954]|jgi:sporulation and cell division protein SsgA|uniref:SsgA family sporulation/cell division regulator n=1 Tax=unclassified Streptomyces TaxID=2593676 RepID=UPI003416A86C